MDLDMIFAGTLGPSFPLPTNAPFATAQARTAGVSHLQLGRLVTEGLLRRPIKGVLLPAEAATPWSCAPPAPSSSRRPTAWSSTAMPAGCSART